MNLHRLDLYTADPVRTRAFYTQRLRLPIVSESATHLTLQAGRTRLTFRAVSQPVAPYHLAFNVPVGSLERAQQVFGLTYLSTHVPGQNLAHFSDWRAWAGYFYDETGNLLEFIERHDLRPEPTATGGFIECVSEIGIATEDVPYTARVLSRQYGVPLFGKATPRFDFTALGDDSGLFVLSQVGRKWLFTDTPAALNYCRVTFEARPGAELQTLSSHEINALPIGYAAERTGTALPLTHGAGAARVR
jgi:catechol 2,3-dioxygenase-like lactoylglutathione lyase family enzyme